MTEVINEKASLYIRFQVSMGAPSSNTNTSFYVLKEGQSIAKYIKGNNIAYGKFKTNVLKIFSDCKPLVEKIKNKKYKRKHLEDMVNYYNENCRNFYEYNFV